MGDYGIRVSKPGVDVLTGAAKDMVYDSRYNGMKVKTHNTKAASGSLAHGLSYVPTFLNFTEDSGKYRLEYRGTTYSNDTNIVFGAANNYYFIFIDKG